MHVLYWLSIHVSYVCFKCFICSRWMLQSVLYVASICFKYFQVFHMYVCKCFIWMLHMFAMVFKYFSGVFASVSDALFQVFHPSSFVRYKCFIDYCIWNAHGKRPTARAMFVAACDHYWCAPSGVRLARRLFTRCTGSVRMLAPARDVWEKDAFATTISKMVYTHARIRMWLMFAENVDNETNSPKLNHILQQDN